MTAREAGRELDAEVAGRVMGWTAIDPEYRGPRGEHWFVPTGEAPGMQRDPIPVYSTDIAAAFQVVEAMTKRGWALEYQNIHKHDVKFSHRGPPPRLHSVYADDCDTLPLGICLAALAALDASQPIASSAVTPSQPSSVETK